jgi:hypothetical protein
MTPTLRRLNDRERYWGLTWPGWIAVSAGAGSLYLAIRLSPLSAKPTITVTLFGLTLVGMVLYGVSGQALSAGRQLMAVISYRRSAKLLALSTRAERRGLVLDTGPPPTEDELSPLEVLSADDPLAGGDRDGVRPLSCEGPLSGRDNEYAAGTSAEGEDG